MQHEPYLKIAEASAAWALDESEQRALERCVWLMTEKIHGANLCLMTRGDVVFAAKRKALLQPDEPFFNAQEIVARTQRPLIALCQTLQARDAGVTGIAVYGELYGGRYPHPEVAPREGVEPVQTGVWYTPELAFCAFDLAIEREDGARAYLDWPLASELLEAHGIMASAILARGELGAMMAASLTFDSTIPARHGLPPLAEPNLAEGVVVRPAQEIVFERPQGPLRPLIKRKHPRFAEDARYHQAQPWGERGMPRDALSLVERQLVMMLNPNRVAAATSKLGRPRDEAERAALRALIAQDIWDDVTARDGALVRALDEEEVALLREVLADLVAGHPL